MLSLRKHQSAKLITYFKVQLADAHAKKAEI